MKTGQHTPGPWFVKRCDDDYHQCMTVVVDKDLGKSNLGQLTEEESRHVVAITYHQLDPTVDLEDAYENSTLIAAAPELLDALSVLAKAVEQERRMFVAYSTNPTVLLDDVIKAQVDTSSAIRRAEEVITKATGA